MIFDGQRKHCYIQISNRINLTYKSDNTGVNQLKKDVHCCQSYYVIISCIFQNSPYTNIKKFV